jgi:RNA polymerase sigma-70 factor, ECF subfamily
MDMCSTQSPPLAASLVCVRSIQDKRYVESIEQFGSALTRLARAYESDADRRSDLLQEVHVALWKSFAVFDERCSLRTWVYRVAHIIGIKHVTASRRLRLNEMYSIEEVPEIEDEQSGAVVADQQDSLRRLMELVEKLKPFDRQVILLYLEDLSAEEIGEVVGLSARNIATKVHRIKKLLTTMFHAGLGHE